MTISAFITVDLTADYDETYSSDRRRLQVLERVPDGARVVIDVGARQWFNQDTASWLHRHGERLNIEITGRDPNVVDRLVRGARSGLEAAS